MTLSGHDRTLQQYWREDIRQVTGLTPGPTTGTSTGAAQSSLVLTAGSGLTGGGDLTADRTFAVGAGLGITVNQDDVALAQAAAGAGLTYTLGVLAVGQGAGLTVAADEVALTLPGTLSATSTDGSSGNHTHAITASANPGAAASLLKTGTSGALQLEGLGVGVAPSTGAVMLTTGGRVEAGYTAGWAGSGFSLQKTAGGSLLELDDLSVRGTMNVYELLVRQIRATNGSIFVANTGKVQTSTSRGADGSTWGIATETAHGFSSGDLIRAQRFSGSAVWKIDMVVSSAADTEHFWGTLTTAGGGSTDAPAAGMEFVRLGNTDDPDRQGSIYLTADDTNAPYINVLSGVALTSQWGDSSKLKVRLGNMNGSYGVSANSYGIGLGEYSTAGNYLRYTSTGGLQVHGSNGNIDLSTDGLRIHAHSTAVTDLQQRASFYADSLGGAGESTRLMGYLAGIYSSALSTQLESNMLLAGPGSWRNEMWEWVDGSNTLQAFGWRVRYSGSNYLMLNSTDGSTNAHLHVSGLPILMDSGHAIGLSTSDARLEFNSSQLHAHNTHLVIDDQHWLGMSSAAGRLTFYDGSPDNVALDDAHFSVNSGKAIGFEGYGGDTYVYYSSANNRLEFYVNGTYVARATTSGGLQNVV